MSEVPEYLRLARIAFPGETDLQIELWLAQTYGVEKKTGLTRHQHRMAAMAMMFPNRQVSDWRERRVESIQRCRDKRVKELGWSGSTSSGKTSDLADAILELWWESPENTTIYIASPTRIATETNLWGVIVEQFHAAKLQAGKDASGQDVLPGKLMTSATKIVLMERHPRSFIAVATVDDLGKLVGKKSVDPRKGLLLLVIDESPALPNGGAEVIAVLENLHGVENFLLLYAGNFADTMDAMGTLGEPVGGYEAIKGQEDTLFEYRTRRGGLFLRFDGHDSPNIRNVGAHFKGLVTSAYLSELAERNGGVNSPGYMRWARSFPVLDVAEFRVTTLGAIEAGYADDPVLLYTSEPFILVSFCDPGFGGDPCVIQNMRLGIEMRGGKRTRVAELMGPPYTVPIDLKKMGPDGKVVTPEAQIVAFHKKMAGELNIPARNCGYDGSLRSGIVHQYASDWGLEVQPIDSQGLASERIFDFKTKSTWRDEMANFTTEHWFAVGLCIQAGRLRGLKASPAARSAILRRPWKWKGAKKQILPKPEFKAINSSRSPNEADALCGALELLRRLGFQFYSPSANSGGVMAMLSKMQSEADSARQLTVNIGETLPRGVLHGMASEQSLNRGRLSS